MPQKFNIDQLELDIESISDEKLKRTFTYLLNFIEELHTSNKKLQRENQELRDEVNRLKGEQGKPNIKANSKPNYKDISTNGQEKRQQKHRKQAKKKNIPVDGTEYVNINKSQLPPDAEFKYWDNVITQDIIFERRNTLYEVAVYYSPSEKKTYLAKMPAGAAYHSDGLKSFAILQNKVCDVTSKKLLTMLQSIGIEISAGSLSNILLEHTDLAVVEKTANLKAGLSHSYSQTDITGARVAGKNHYTHIITNDFFTSYTTLAGKSTLQEF